MTKVKLPREVAKAIDAILAGNEDNRMNRYGIITRLDNQKELGRNPEMLILNEYFNVIEWNSPRHPHTLMEALVNGYEVEKSPEDELREYYRSGETSTQEAQAIRATLGILGIKIGGINTQ